MDRPQLMRVAIVHYHLDPGGVTRVIERTSEILTKNKICHAILTGESPNPTFRNHVAVRGLGYHPKPSSLTASHLLASLRDAAQKALGAPPDVWHFHNHSLGKNCLIAEVVAQLAEANEALLLHIHDLAENGRPQNYPIISEARMLYPVGDRIHYAFLNSEDLSLFQNAGLPSKNASLLPNPVTIPKPTPHADHSAPILFAPIRAIRRKNIGELILIASLLPETARIAVSRAPLNPEEISIHHHWEKFALKQKLPIAFNVVDRFSPSPGAAASFESWLFHTTHFITTSICEGFGFPFLESIAQCKPLIGRDLPNVTSGFAQQGIQCGRLYQRLLVPAEWIDETILRSHLTTSLERTYRMYERQLTNRLIDETVHQINLGGHLDFGNLPEPLQQAVIERMTEISAPARCLVQLPNGSTRGLQEWLEEVVAQREPLASPAELDYYSLERYGIKLKNIYQNLINQSATQVRPLSPRAVLDAHLTSRPFHFLLAPAAPRAAVPRYKAVVFDIYGTLLIAPAGGVKPDPEADHAISTILQDFGYTPPASPTKELYDAVMRHHRESKFAHPEVDLRNLWKEILSIDSHDDITLLVIAIENAWHPSHPMPGGFDIVRFLSRSGISLGLLSNAQCNTLDSLKDLCDLFPPELRLLSYQHGIAKPSAKLFELMVDRLAGRGIRPEETLFIGNDPLHDIIPAQAAGFHTALFAGHHSAFRHGECSPDHTLGSWVEANSIIFPEAHFAD